MHIKAEVNAYFEHLLAHQKHLGGARQARALPLAVQVGAGGIGAQIAAHRAIGIHVGHEVKHALGQQHTRDGVVGIEQALQKALGKPLGHGFAGMLAGDQPDLLFERQRGRTVRVGNAQQGQVAPVERQAQMLHLHAFRHGRRADQVEVALVGIGFEIGEIDTLRRGREARRHDLAVELGVDAKPVLAIHAGQNAVVLPAPGVSALARVEKAQRHRYSGRALQAKVKPLREVAGVVAPNSELDVAGILQAQHLDGAGIEGA